MRVSSQWSRSGRRQPCDGWRSPRSNPRSSRAELLTRRWSDGTQDGRELRVTLTRLLLFSITAEALTGVALFIAPSWVGRLLLGTSLSPSGTAVARVCGCALFSLGVAWWGGLRSDDATAPAFRGMLFYNAAITVYLDTSARAARRWARSCCWSCSFTPWSPSCLRGLRCE